MSISQNSNQVDESIRSEENFVNQLVEHPMDNLDWFGISQGKQWTDCETETGCYRSSVLCVTAAHWKIKYKHRFSMRARKLNYQLSWKISVSRSVEK